METLAIIKDILNENMSVEPDAVTGDSTFDSLGIDSLGVVELICELEDRLDIDFGEPENLTNVNDLVAYIDTLR